MKCLSRAPLALRVVSPYIGKVPPFGSVAQLANFLFTRDCELFEIVTLPPSADDDPNRPEGTLRISEADIIVSRGVDLLVRPRLHSKVYQFLFPNGDRAAFVGSANFTARGFGHNDESMAFIYEETAKRDQSAKDFNESVRQELERLSGHGSEDYTFWKIRRSLHSKPAG